MKKLLFLILSVLLSVLLSLSSCFAESSIHSLWDIDQTSMTAQQIHDYLYNEKGIVSSVVRNYDRQGHNSLNSRSGQALDLFGFPFSFHYTEYAPGNFILMNFEKIVTESDAKALAQCFIDAYGLPGLSYYDLYNRSDLEWEYNIGDPMYHDRAFVSDLDSFNISETLESWEHFEINRFMFGQISLSMYIDNILISIDHRYEGYFNVSVTFYSFIPSVQIDEVRETKNISSYVDTGL
jgi:hypothetical protein